jgi:hypothetical protein
MSFLIWIIGMGLSGVGCFFRYYAYRKVLLNELKLSKVYLRQLVSVTINGIEVVRLGNWDFNVCMGLDTLLSCVFYSLFFFLIWLSPLIPEIDSYYDKKLSMYLIS